ncbi:MAG: DUF2877 domain-containing protein [Anaerolineaceae bacterium]|nr:DUF2877 domain-containing protein [Anaerolineaceae bacterium]
MIPLTLSASSIGTMAYQSQLKETRAAVLGSISKGIYLLAPGKRVIYITYEPYRSPLTITLRTAPISLSAIQTGDQVRISPTSIDWLNRNISLSLADAEIWSAAEPPEMQGTAGGCYKRLVEIARQVTAAKGQLGFAPLLLPILGLADTDRLSVELTSVWIKLHGLLHDPSSSTPASLIEILSDLIGFGRGLTPSGDDFITGFLLAGARGLNVHSSELRQAIIRTAYQKTTTLSANLIECAAAGQADERLIQVLDAVTTGEKALQPGLEQLLNYGSSSGADTLAGIALAARLKLCSQADTPFSS